MITPPVVALLLALGWLLVPGLTVGAAIGLRGWLLASAAPALTMGAVAATGLLFTANGTRWTPGSVEVAVLVIGAVLTVIARPWRVRRTRSARPRSVADALLAKWRPVRPTRFARLSSIQPAWFTQLRQDLSGWSARTERALSGWSAPLTRVLPSWSAGPASSQAVPMPSRWAWWEHAAVGAALAVGGALGVHNTYLVTDRFNAVNQTWDAFFHAGAIRWIADNGNPSPAALGAIGAPAAHDFFMPNAYHCVGALVYLQSGLPVPTVINALAAVLQLLLGLGVVGLCRVTTGRPAHAVCAALLSAVVAAVPYHMIGYGALLPYGTALVMLPGALALIAALLDTGSWRVAAALGIAAAGLLHTHPQVAFLAAIAAGLQLVWHVGTTRRLPLRLLGGLAISLVIFGGLGAPPLASALAAASTASEIDWPIYANPARAVGDLLLFSATNPYPQWWLVPLLLAGLVAVVRPGPAATLRPFVGAAALIAGLYVLAGAYDTDFSLKVTSLWWNDRHRFAAAFGVFAIVFAAGGTVWLRDLLIPAALRRNRLFGRVAPALMLLVVLLGLTAATDRGYTTQTQATLAAGYGTDGVSLSDAERAGLQVVDRIVTAGGGGLVMNDPHDGCGWAYPLYGTHMVFPVPLTGPFDWSRLGYDRLRMHNSFDQLDTNPVVLADSQRLGIRWAVLCSGFIRSWQTRAPGLYNVGAIPSAQLVYSNGAVRLFRIQPPTTIDALAATR